MIRVMYGPMYVDDSEEGEIPNLWTVPTLSSSGEEEFLISYKQLHNFAANLESAGTESEPVTRYVDFTGITASEATNFSFLTKSAGINLIGRINDADDASSILGSRIFDDFELVGPGTKTLPSDYYKGSSTTGVGHLVVNATDGEYDFNNYTGSDSVGVGLAAITVAAAAAADDDQQAATIKGKIASTIDSVTTKISYGNGDTALANAAGNDEIAIDSEASHAILDQDFLDRQSINHRGKSFIDFNGRVGHLVDLEDSDGHSLNDFNIKSTGPVSLYNDEDFDHDDESLTPFFDGSTTHTANSLLTLVYTGTKTFTGHIHGDSTLKVGTNSSIGNLTIGGEADVSDASIAIETGSSLSISSDATISGASITIDASSTLTITAEQYEDLDEIVNNGTLNITDGENVPAIDLSTVTGSGNINLTIGDTASPPAVTFSGKTSETTHIKSSTDLTIADGATIAQGTDLTIESDSVTTSVAQYALIVDLENKGTLNITDGENDSAIDLSKVTGSGDINLTIGDTASPPAVTFDGVTSATTNVMSSTDVTIGSSASIAQGTDWSIESGSLTTTVAQYESIGDLENGGRLNITDGQENPALDLTTVKETSPPTGTIYLTIGGGSDVTYTGKATGVTTIESTVNVTTGVGASFNGADYKISDGLLDITGSEYEDLDVITNNGSLKIRDGEKHPGIDFTSVVEASPPGPIQFYINGDSTIEGRFTDAVDVYQTAGSVTIESSPPAQISGADWIIFEGSSLTLSSSQYNELGDITINGTLNISDVENDPDIDVSGVTGSGVVNLIIGDTASPTAVTFDGSTSATTHIKSSTDVTIGSSASIAQGTDWTVIDASLTATVGSYALIDNLVNNGEVNIPDGENDPEIDLSTITGSGIVNLEIEGTNSPPEVDFNGTLGDFVSVRSTTSVTIGDSATLGLADWEVAGSTLTISAGDVSGLTTISGSGTTLVTDFDFTVATSLNNISTITTEIYATLGADQSIDDNDLPASGSWFLRNESGSSTLNITNDSENKESSKNISSNFFQLQSTSPQLEQEDFTIYIQVKEERDEYLKHDFEDYYTRNQNNSSSAVDNIHLDFMPTTELTFGGTENTGRLTPSNYISGSCKIVTIPSLIISGKEFLEKTPESSHSSRLVATELHNALDADFRYINLDNLDIRFGTESIDRTFVGFIKNNTDTVQVTIRKNSTMRVGRTGSATNSPPNLYDHRLEFLTPIGVKLFDSNDSQLTNQKIHITGPGNLVFSEGSSIYSNSVDLQLFGSNIYFSGAEITTGTEILSDRYLNQTDSIEKIVYHGIHTSNATDFIYNNGDDVTYYENSSWQDNPESSASPPETFASQMKFGLLIKDATFSCN